MNKLEQAILKAYEDLGLPKPTNYFGGLIETETVIYVGGAA